MKLMFTHAGRKRTLSKHATVQRDLRTGGLTDKAAASKPWYLRFNVAGQERAFKLPATEREAIRAAKDLWFFDVCNG